MTEREKLLARSRRLRSQMRKLGPMIKGSVHYKNIKCGKSNCHCARGRHHFYLCINYREEGKSKTIYVDKEREAYALVWSANYKRFKQFLEEHTKINYELLKREKKTRRKT